MGDIYKHIKFLDFKLSSEKPIIYVSLSKSGWYVKKYRDKIYFLKFIL